MNIEMFYEQILKKLPYHPAIFFLRAVNWLFQGLLYASWNERIIKIFIDISLTLIFTIIIHNFNSLNISLIYAFIIAHSFNWIFATNIWSTRLKTYSGIHYDPNYCQDFFKALQKSLQRQNRIYGAAIFGSMSTGRFHTGSDIDVKLFRKTGFLNLIYSYLFLFYIRTKANFCMIPLDIYVLDNIDNYSLKKGEIPLIIHDIDKTIEDFYKDIRHFKL